MAEEWIIWRPAMEGYGTYTEIRDTWDLVEVAKANLMLDVQGIEQERQQPNVGS